MKHNLEAWIRNCAQKMAMYDYQSVETLSKEAAESLITHVKPYAISVDVVKLISDMGLMSEAFWFSGDNRILQMRFATIIDTIGLHEHWEATLVLTTEMLKTVSDTRAMLQSISPRSDTSAIVHAVSPGSETPALMHAMSPIAETPVVEREAVKKSGCCPFFGSSKSRVVPQDNVLGR